MIIDDVKLARQALTKTKIVTLAHMAFVCQTKAEPKKDFGCTLQGEILCHLSFTMPNCDNILKSSVRVLEKWQALLHNNLNPSTLSSVLW